MVVLHIKHGDESQFLFGTTAQAQIEDVLVTVVKIYNGRLKVQRICCELEQLCMYGICLPPEMRGLTEEQISELHFTDTAAETCIPSGGTRLNKDPCGRRNGQQPVDKMQEVLTKTRSEAKGMISKELVKSNICLTEQHILDALSILEGAVKIVYPMGLPEYDPLKQEFDDTEDLSGTQDEKMVLDPATTQLWFAGKQLQSGEKLSKYTGKNEKTKVVVKLQKRGSGAPSREVGLSEEAHEFLMKEMKRREELRRLEADDDDRYLDSEWADSKQLHKSFQGLTNITWKPH